MRCRIPAAAAIFSLCTIGTFALRRASLTFRRQAATVSAYFFAYPENHMIEIKKSFFSEEHKK